MIDNKKGENAVSVAAKPKMKKIFVEHEEPKWEKMLEDENFTQFEEIDYKDKDLKNAYNKFKSKVEASMVDQMLYFNKSVFLDDETREALAESLAESLTEEGEGKKRKKSIRKKKRRKARKTNKKM
jgi:hypothetical protein